MKDGAWGPACGFGLRVRQSNYVMSAKDAMKYVDENTIGVFV